MEGLDYWRLCDELSVKQVALLIIGEDPALSQEWIDGWDPNNRPAGYDAAMAAISHAVLSKKIPATIRNDNHESYDPISEITIQNESIEPNWDRTTIQLNDIRAWLSSRGFHSGFFFPASTGGPAYLDALHPRYAPKLAAAINAWLAMNSDETIKGKSPKQALLKWLREHASVYKLSDDDGKPNETGIEECAKVANWKDKGGAPKTP